MAPSLTRQSGSRSTWCSGGDVQWRWASRPLPALTRSVEYGGGQEDTVLSWRVSLCSPHFLYILPARQRPTTQLGWAPPTRELSQGPDSVVGPSRWRSTLTFSLLFSPLYFKLFNLNLTLYFLFIYFALGHHLIADQCVGRTSS